MNIDELKKCLSNSPIINIDGKKYRELCNVTYKIDFDIYSLIAPLKPHMEDDLLERNYLLKRLDECITELKRDKHSRRAVFSNLYPNGLGKCISLVQVFIRNDIVNMNLYYRSQEADRNLQFDIQTANLMMEKLIKDLESEPGEINVFVTSFHREIN